MKDQKLNEKLFILQMKLAMTKFSYKDITPIKQNIEKYKISIEKLINEQKGENKNGQYKRR